MNARSLVIGIVTLLAVAGVSLGKSAKGGGTSILHFKARTPLSPTASSIVSGEVNLNQNRQGNADNQRFDLQVSGLTAGNTYLVLISTNGGTVLSVVSAFTADADGSMTFRQMQVESRKGKGKGKGKEPLPVGMDPLAAIREIVIADINTSAAGTLIPLDSSNVVNVASANLRNPASITYLVSRSMNPTGVDSDAAGALRIKANSNGADLSLSVSGLSASATSLLWTNGVQWLNSINDAGGNVQFKANLTAAEALAIRTLAVSDASSTLILTTVIP